MIFSRYPLAYSRLLSERISLTCLWVCSPCVARRRLAAAGSERLRRADAAAHTVGTGAAAHAAPVALRPHGAPGAHQLPAVPGRPRPLTCVASAFDTGAGSNAPLMLSCSWHVANAFASPRNTGHHLTLP